jgi:hypothetical protein
MTKTKLTLCSLAALFAAGQAFAHTGVRDAVLEGTNSYNGFTITHGCGGDSGQPYPVLGQSALFPFGTNVVWKDAAGTVIEEGGNGLGTITAPTLSLAVNGYAGFSSPFTTSQEIVDVDGAVQALFWKDGAMEPKLNAVTPFKITAPVIANNCVKSLKIRMGVINYCDLNKNAVNDVAGPYIQPRDAWFRTIPNLSIAVAGIPGVQTNVAGSPVYVTLPAGNGDNNRADWWFQAPYPGTSAVYNDIDLLQPAYWTTMTVNNSAADIAACVAGGGTPADVTVEPTAPAFDTYLTGPNTRPFTKGLTGL